MFVTDSGRHLVEQTSVIRPRSVGLDDDGWPVVGKVRLRRAVHFLNPHRAGTDVCTLRSPGRAGQYRLD